MFTMNYTDIDEKSVFMVYKTFQILTIILESDGRYKRERGFTWLF